MTKAAHRGTIRACWHKLFDCPEQDLKQAQVNYDPEGVQKLSFSIRPVKLEAILINIICIFGALHVLLQ